MKKYGNDYRKKENGYEYTGEWYTSPLNTQQLSRQSLISFALLTPMTILFLAGLSFDNAGGRIFWILIPYVTMGLPLAYGWMGSAALYTFCRKQKQGKTERSDGRGRTDSTVVIPKEHQGKMLRSEYEKGIRRPLRCGIVLILLSSLSLAADVWMLFQHNAKLSMVRESCFAAMISSILFCSIVLTWQCVKTKKGFSHESATKSNS